MLDLAPCTAIQIAQWGIGVSASRFPASGRDMEHDGPSTYGPSQPVGPGEPLSNFDPRNPPNQGKQSEPDYRRQRERERDAKVPYANAYQAEFAGTLKGMAPRADGHSLGIIGDIGEGACVGGGLVNEVANAVQGQATDRNQGARPATAKEAMRFTCSELRQRAQAIMRETRVMREQAEQLELQARGLDELASIMPDLSRVAPGADRALAILVARQW